MSRHRNNRKVGAALLALMLSSGLSTAALARDAAPQATAAEAQKPQLQGLESFVDGVVASGLANREIAGAVVVVVADGKVLFNKGYGYSDVAKGVAVDPERTLFRPGSVSKLFTWTALMQQIEAGKVGLDDPVEKYIDFKMPTTAFNKPIRIRDLFTHTPGFEDTYVGMFSKSTSEFEPLGKFLATHIPGRVRQPGVEASYSNYGTALAGYIVQRVSGEAFPDYIEKHIFAPLGMTHSTFREPVPEGWELAKSYDFTEGRFVEKPGELITNIAPAGSLSATGADMARFMLAHLQDGTLDNGTILKPETARRMRERLFANAPSLPGIAYGFLEYNAANPRIVGHGGNTGYFHSDLMIVPEAGVGVFVSFTGGDGSSIARSELMHLVTERLFPAKPLPLWTGAPSEMVEGFYRPNRRGYAPGTISAASLIRIRKDGERGLSMEIGGKTVRWEQVGPRLFRQTGEDTTPLGPLGKLEFYGEGADTRFSFEHQPYMLFRLVP